MTERALFMGVLLVMFAPVAGAQAAKVPCWSGVKFASCTPEERLAKANALGRAKSATVIIKATRTISCGDGSEGPCIGGDGAAVTIIQREVDESELWQNLKNVNAKKADILLKFTSANRSSLELCAWDADSNDELWCESRSPSVALDVID
jgi:hypothetical protein